MYIFNIENVIKMTVKNLRKFIFEKYYTWIGFTKEDSCYLSKKAKKKKGKEKKRFSIIKLKKSWKIPKPSKTVKAPQATVRLNLFQSLENNKI